MDRTGAAASSRPCFLKQPAAARAVRRESCPRAGAEQKIEDPDGPGRSAASKSRKASSALPPEGIRLRHRSFRQRWQCLQIIVPLIPCGQEKAFLGAGSGTAAKAPLETLPFACSTCYIRNGYKTFDWRGTTMAYKVTDACVNCGSCEASCPNNAISEKNGARYIDPSKCVSCGTCASNCPVEAIVEE